MTAARRPVRVLFPFAGGPNMGGSHISALGLICGLDRDRFEPVVLLHDGTGPFAEALCERGLGFERLGDASVLGSAARRSSSDAGLPGYLLRTLPALRRKILQINPRIVHTNDGRMHANWALPTKLSGRMLVWHHRQDPQAFGINKIAPLLADHIISVSHFAKPTRPLRDIDRKFSVVRSPFAFSPEVPDKVASHRAICDELGLPHDAALLGYFGNLTERKRPLHFVSAVAAVQAALPDTPVHGLIFGNVAQPGSRLDERTMDLANELGIGAAIHLMGFRVPIEAYMAGVDVKLVTALNEPFGRTLIEAMHLGTPVVAADHGGNREAIKDGVNGFLVDPKAPEAFVEPVANLLRNPDLYRRIVLAAREELPAYGEDGHISQISAIYEGLLGEQGT